jgi:DNA-binding NtrC family response regulator
MAGKTLKVLVYDDQAAVVDALRVLFEIHDIPLVSATGQDDVLDLIAREPVGVVIQDMNFSPNQTSGQEGIDLFHRIREIEPDLPVLLITAWASLETAVQLIKEGANDYLAKPWDDDKLVTTVKTLLRMRALQLENTRLQADRRHARAALAESYDLCDLIYESDAMHHIVSIALNVADSNAPVLITGPSGSGKEKVAEIIKANSRHPDGPFVRVNLGAIPESLMESELFGAESGAYTGLKGTRIGRFEAAHGGTLFLDEIDALPLSGQVKLLRVLQSGEFQRLGSSRTRSSSVRIISATNTDLEAAIAEGRFREDLYYRLNVVEITLPPLRTRTEDIGPLSRHFLARFTAGREAGPLKLGTEVVAALEQQAWPGNVRELENRIQRATLVAGGTAITPADLGLEPGGETASPNRADGPGAADRSVDAATSAQRRRIEEALVKADGVVARAAQELGLSRQALYRKMARHGIVLERRPRS